MRMIPLALHAIMIRKSKKESSTVLTAQEQETINDPIGINLCSL